MKALLAVSFGTSHADTRERTIDAICARLQDAFADRAFYSAWTSSFIVKKVRRDRGENHDTLEEAFTRLASDGANDVVVATTCLMDGHEMGKIKAAADAWAAEDACRVVRIATPLLFDDADRRAMARAICDEFAAVSSDEAVLLMGHGLEDVPAEIAGSAADPNFVYAQIQAEFAALGKPHFVVATVEGKPTFSDGLAALGRTDATCVHLAPFMIVAGDHAKNDLAGDGEDSWASQLKARGFSVQVALKGLGEYAAVQQMVVDHALAADRMSDAGGRA